MATTTTQTPTTKATKAVKDLTMTTDPLAEPMTIPAQARSESLRDTLAGTVATLTAEAVGKTDNTKIRTL